MAINKKKTKKTKKRVWPKTILWMGRRWKRRSSIFGIDYVREHELLGVRGHEEDWDVFFLHFLTEKHEEDFSAETKHHLTPEAALEALEKLIRRLAGKIE